MSRAFITLAVALVASVLSAVAVVAQEPRIANGRITSQAASVLQQTFDKAVAAQGDVAWIGYGVPMIDGDRTMCCANGGRWINDRFRSDGSSCCATCGIEPSVDAAGTSMSTRRQQPASGPIKLEGADQLVVLFRIVNRQVERVRVFSDECQLDAGGRDVIWLTGVRPADSVLLLESMVKGVVDRRDRIADGAITAIALHEEATADAALERLLAPAMPTAIREKVPFWLGNARGRRGLELLQRVMKDDPSTEVRKKAVFGTSQSQEAGAVDLLIATARGGSEPNVRGEAIFWLAQRAGNKAAAAITERIEQDPDTEVKKRAVFALSQLPKSEGVPLLIQVARTNPNPAVKKQAIFWLGQSKDPRALDYFAEILK
jgi:hypothetical protein